MFVQKRALVNKNLRPKSTANSTDIAVLTVEGVIFKRNRAAGSICAAVELLRVDPCRFFGRTCALFGLRPAPLF